MIDLSLVIHFKNLLYAIGESTMLKTMGPVFFVLLVYLSVACSDSSGDSVLDGDAEADGDHAEDRDDASDGDADISSPDGDGEAEWPVEDGDHIVSDGDVEEVDDEGEGDEDEQTPILPGDLGRAADPVIIDAAALSDLLGTDPAHLAAFRYSDETAWTQIAIQVDQRHMADYYDLYNKQYGGPGNSLLVYSDAGTLAGEDPDPMLDADDELIFMAREAGVKAGAGEEPPGVTPGSGIELHITDPGDNRYEAWAYLFAHDGQLDPSAGISEGAYTFSLEAGVYPDDYGFASGPNPEDSWFVSDLYERHFVDRWIGDVMTIKTPGATQVDVLDQHGDQFLRGLCSRSILTFSHGEGAFVTNKQGPLRTIRSYIGANSGPRTQRTHLFYRGREDIITDLRVHEIIGMLDYFDFSAEAVGMRYTSDVHPEGVTIDGVPDELSTEIPAWEMISGEQGGLVLLQRFQTNLDLIILGLYLDEDPAGTKPCLGDGAYLGLCGLEVPMTSGIPCTDPGMGCDGHLSVTRYVYFEAPDVSIRQAEDRARFIDDPLVATAAAFNGDME